MCKHEQTYIKKVTYQSAAKKTNVKYKCPDCGAGCTKNINHVTHGKHLFGDVSVHVAFYKNKKND